ncbi:PPC domain-containing protein [Pannus brasiliensis CCIBt3594]|uniref:PPC domain-containing protein n=1 Tax=Pannus brasiliensis CCIBt3594 TaxID=1427578 RepID=A0AAW9QKZ2_9CHRO
MMFDLLTSANTTNSVFPQSFLNFQNSSWQNLSLLPNTASPSNGGLGTLTIDNAGNTLATARAIAVGATPTTYSDFIGSVDTNDYYRFTLGATSTFNLALTGLSADADVSLLDTNGNVIAGSYNGGTTNDSITRQLSAGTYYARVYQYSGDTNYNLALSATTPDNAGNTLATARAIAVGATPTTYSDFIGSVDTNDYYRFTLGATSTFNLALTGLSADADVSLLDTNGNVIAGSYNGGTTNDSITRQLSAGTYYARVYQYSGDTNYNLALSATTPDNAGNTLATARAIAVGATPTTYISPWARPLPSTSR